MQILAIHLRPRYLAVTPWAGVVITIFVAAVYLITYIAGSLLGDMAGGLAGLRPANVLAREA